MKSRDQYLALQHYHAGWDMPLEHAKALVCHLTEQYSGLHGAFECHAEHVENIKSRYQDESGIQQDLLQLEKQVLEEINKYDLTHAQDLSAVRNMFLLKLNKVLVQKYSEEFFDKNAQHQLDPQHILKHFAMKALMSDFLLCMEAEEKRFIHSKKNQHSQDEIDQRNLFPRQYEIRQDLYKAILAKNHLDPVEAGLIEKIFMQMQEFWYCFGEDYPNSLELKRHNQFMLGLYDEYLLKINKLYPARSTSQNIKTKPHDLVEANIYREWLHWLEKKNQKGENLFDLLNMMNQVMRNESAGDYVRKLQNFSLKLIEQHHALEVQQSAMKAQSVQSPQKPSMNSIEFKGLNLKTYMFIVGGLSLSMLLLIAAVATGGMAVVALGIVHVLHVSLLAAKLGVVGTVMFAGGGAGFGAKKTQDVCLHKQPLDSSQAESKKYELPVISTSKTKLEKPVSLNQLKSSLQDIVAPVLGVGRKVK